MASIIEIVNGISQAARNIQHDGALNEDGEPIEIGLKREIETPIIDSRIMDGFGVTMSGDRMKLSYQSEVTLKEVQDKKFEDETADMLETIIRFLKKEYRKVTKNTLSLEQIGKPELLVQNVSRRRSWVNANCWYKIGGMDGVESHMDEESDKSAVDKMYTKWNELVKGTKKMKNVTRSKDEVEV